MNDPEASALRLQWQRAGVLKGILAHSSRGLALQQTMGEPWSFRTRSLLLGHTVPTLPAWSEDST